MSAHALRDRRRLISLYISIKMAKNNKIQMPSGQGGLQRFDDEVSNFQISPGAVVVICAVAMIVIVALHMFGGALL